MQTIKIGLISTSDRASSGIYQDEGIPALKSWLHTALVNPIECIERLVADEQDQIEGCLKELADDFECDLILTTGGTGPAKRDVTPEATLAVLDKELPGFGEQMRQISLNFVPTAILSRQTAGIRNRTLIINLPGRPRAITETLEGLKDEEGNVLVKGIFASVPYCVDLIGGPRIETHIRVIEAFRPKK